jgi:hypothetical protein
MDFGRDKEKSSKSTLWTLAGLTAGVFVVYTLFYKPESAHKPPLVHKVSRTPVGSCNVA